MNTWEAGLTEPLLKYMKNPADTPAIQAMYECYAKDEKVLRAFEKTMLSNAEFRALYEQWYVPEKFTLEQLLELPEDTFGFFYATHMKKNNLDLDFISSFKDKNILSYLWERAKHVHDICHVVAGYDTSLLGEVGIKGFEIAQTGSPPSMGIVGGAFVTLPIVMPEMVRPMVDTFLEGYEKGKRYPLMMAIKWDQEFKTPMTELKRKYDIP